MQINKFAGSCCQFAGFKPKFEGKGNHGVAPAKFGEVPPRPQFGQDPIFDYIPAKFGTTKPDQPGDAPAKLGARPLVPQFGSDIPPYQKSIPAKFGEVPPRPQFGQDPIFDYIPAKFGTTKPDQPGDAPAKLGARPLVPQFVHRVLVESHRLLS